LTKKIKHYNKNMSKYRFSKVTYFGVIKSFIDLFEYGPKILYRTFVKPLIKLKYESHMLFTSPESYVRTLGEEIAGLIFNFFLTLFALLIIVTAPISAIFVVLINRIILWRQSK
jgi:hypothetical protein